MTKPVLSRAAAGLFRALTAKAAAYSSKFLLTEFRSIDWQSLTFIGERHEIQLRIPAPDAHIMAERISSGLNEDEFAIPGQIVAEIRLEQPFEHHEDGSISLHIEALTIAE